MKAKELAKLALSAMEDPEEARLAVEEGMDKQAEVLDAVSTILADKGVEDPEGELADEAAEMIVWVPGHYRLEG